MSNNGGRLPRAWPASLRPARRRAPSERRGAARATVCPIASVDEAAPYIANADDPLTASDLAVSAMEPLLGGLSRR
jgi:hypothetical protein